MKENPSYYAIIPACVRYDNELKANEKLLYGEITALSQSNGVCFATNEYFSNLYGASKETVSRWLSGLEKNGYIKREIQYKKGTKEIEKRYITLLTKTSIPYCQKNQYPIDENVKENNTSINNTSIIYKDFLQKFPFISERSFNRLVDHLSSKYNPLTKTRLTNNIKKLKNSPELFDDAVNKMIELDFNGLFVPSKKKEPEEFTSVIYFDEDNYKPHGVF